MNERGREPGVPLEQFITALTSQLDRAQNAMAIKARLGYPLTFAVKDLTLDLKAHLEMVEGAVRMRPAGPGDTEASTIHLSLTTITRPMMEENTIQLSNEPDEPSLDEALADWSPEERRRLEYAGVQTVGQLKEIQKRSNGQLLEKVANLPATRLRAALQRAARPLVREVVPERARSAVPGGAPSGPTRLRIRGVNLASDDGATQVLLGGHPARVIESSPRELLVEPLAGSLGGMLEVETEPGLSFQMQLLALDEPPHNGYGPHGNGSPGNGSGGYGPNGGGQNGQGGYGATGGQGGYGAGGYRDEVPVIETGP